MTKYDMHRRPRGLALIVYIEVYENDVQGEDIGLDLRLMLKTES